MFFILVSLHYLVTYSGKFSTAKFSFHLLEDCGVKNKCEMNIKGCEQLRNQKEEMCAWKEELVGRETRNF